MYKQCTLTKRLDDGTAYMVSWIRAEIAVKGNVLDRLEDTDTRRIETGWTVLTATEPALPEGLLLARSRDYRKTRAASDI